jgi:hypothetical protein
MRDLQYCKAFPYKVRAARVTAACPLHESWKIKKTAGDFHPGGVMLMQDYFLWFKAAWPAARRATGTRNGEQLT